MRIHLIAIGRRVPDWVQAGYDEYARRMPAECRLELHALSSPSRGKSTSAGVRKTREADLLLEAVPPKARIIALDERGSSWSTTKLATQLSGWLDGGTDVALLVGGPDGLDQRCRDAAQSIWSLSALTLPHAMVRVLVAEQLYRANAINHGHPYHRE